MNELPKAIIDTTKGYKYILIQAQHKTTRTQTLILRGDHTHTYHKGIFNEAVKNYSEIFHLECLGGGYLSVNPETKAILLSGVSTEYGPSDHQQAQKILLSEYPDYTCTIKGAKG